MKTMCCCAWSAAWPLLQAPRLPVRQLGRLRCSLHRTSAAPASQTPHATNPHARHPIGSRRARPHHTTNGRRAVDTSPRWHDASYPIPIQPRGPRTTKADGPPPPTTHRVRRYLRYPTPRTLTRRHSWTQRAGVQPPSPPNAGAACGHVNRDGGACQPKKGWGDLRRSIAACLVPSSTKLASASASQPINRWPS